MNEYPIGVSCRCGMFNCCGQKCNPAEFQLAVHKQLIDTITFERPEYQKTVKKVLGMIENS